MSVEVTLLVTHRFFRHSIGGTEVLANDTARTLRARGQNVIWLAVGPDGMAEKVARLRDDAVEEWHISPSTGSFPARNWVAMEAEQTSKVALCLDQYLDGRKITAIHILHFARIGLGFLELPAIQSTPVAATLTDYTCICPDFQLRHRASGKQCNGAVSELNCRCCLVAAGEHVDREAGIGTWLARNRAVMNRCKGLFVQTPFQRKMLEDNGLSDAHFVADRAAYVIPDVWPSRPARPAKPHRFLFIGRASAEKGLDVALHAFAMHRQSREGAQDTLEVILPDPDVAQTLFSSGHGIHWSGPAKFSDLGIILARSDTLLVPSLWYENHPTVLSYAIALGLNVLCSDVPSLTHLAGTPSVHFARTGDRRDWKEQLAKVARQTPDRDDATAPVLPDFNDLIDQLENTLRSAT